jgi:hypothetical protein
MEIKFIITKETIAYAFTNNSELEKDKCDENKEESVSSDEPEEKNQLNLSDFTDEPEEKNQLNQSNITDEKEPLEKYSHYKFWKLIEKMSTITVCSYNNIDDIRNFMPTNEFDYIKAYIDEKACDVEKICKKNGLFNGQSSSSIKNFTYYVVFILGTQYLQCENNIEFIKNIWETQSYENTYDILQSM